LNNNTGSNQTTLSIPKYSKALRQGRGDRLPLEQWTIIEKPVDIVILEGWMLGFSAYQPTLLEDEIPDTIATADHQNIQVNIHSFYIAS